MQALTAVIALCTLRSLCPIVCCVSVSTCLKVFPNLLCDFFFDPFVLSWIFTCVSFWFSFYADFCPHPTVVREQTLCVISVLWTWPRLVVWWPHVWSSLEGPGAVWGHALWMSHGSHFLSACSPLLKGECEVSHYYYRTVSFYVCSFCFLCVGVCC